MKKHLLSFFLLACLALSSGAQVRLTGGKLVGGKLTKSAGGGGGSTASDDFNRADALTLGSNWTVQVTAYDCQVLSNQARGQNGQCYAFWSGAGSFADDQFSQATFATYTAAAGILAAVGVRQSGSGFGLANVTGYFCGTSRNVGSNDGRYKIWKNIAGTETLLAEGGAGDLPTAGDVLKLSSTFSGGTTTLTCTKGGSAITNLSGVTDSAIGTGGKPGIVAEQTNIDIDTWSAGAP